jgi:hypothetical protein
LLITGAQAANAREGSARGTLTVDGNDLSVEHATYEEGIREMWLIVSTEPADSETVFELSERDGAGLFLALDPATGTAAATWKSRLLHSAFPKNFGAELDPEAIRLDMETLDETRAVGRIWLPEIEVEGHALSFDVEVDATFVKIDPCTDLGPVTVSGESGGPVEAFRAFYQAIASCDWKGLKETLAGELLASWQELEADERSLSLFVELMVREIPRQATVLEVRPEGKERATLVVRFGDADSEPTEMVVERVSRRQWRLVESDIIQM